MNRIRNVLTRTVFIFLLSSGLWASAQVSGFSENCISQIKGRKTGKNIESREIQCPLIPFSAITGKPTKEQVEKYLDSYKNVGINQILIYPRSGLELEYMGKEWLDVCGHIIEYATRNDMKVWLYDEYNWPSGRCGGQVVQQNEKLACQKVEIWADYDPMGKTIGKNLSSRHYFWTISSVPLYADLLNPRAVEGFITLTHDKYYERFGSCFGTVIKGFFTDEPSPGYAATHHKTNGSLLELPWWKSLETEYHEYTGRQFRTDVEAHLNGATLPTLWKDYFYLLGRRFKTSYLDKIREWCDSHKVLFAGHLMSESPPRNAIMANGNPMEAIRSFSMPGIDEIPTQTTLGGVEWVTMKMVENASGKKDVNALAELFALGSCDMSLGKMRQMIWITAMHGVDHYVLAIAPLDSRANIEKPHYYNPYTTTQPWFGALKELGDDAKTAAQYASKTAVQKIAVRYPQTLTASTIFRTNGEKLPFDLPGLLKSLVNGQWDPKLIAEEEKLACKFQAVLTITVNGITEEKSGRSFGSLDELLFWLEQNIPRGATVENTDGKLLDNVLVKTFDDGSVCVVSLLDVSRGNMVLKQAGINPVSFNLPEYGVFTWIPGQTFSKIGNELILSVEELWPYQLTSFNTKRVVFDQTGACEYTLEEGLDSLTIAVRNYSDTVRVKLDGKELPTTKNCRLLPKGLKELYLESEKVSLEKGKHVLSLVTKSQDYPYLPSAFIIGRFGMKENNWLNKLPDSLSIEKFRQQGLLDYTGCITFTQKVAINNHDYLSLGTRGLVTEVLIDGQSLGKRAWAPFRWEIPKNFRNKIVEAEIRIWTSIGPLFGSYPWETGEEGSLLRRFAPE